MLCAQFVVVGVSHWQTRGEEGGQVGLGTGGVEKSSLGNECYVLWVAVLRLPLPRLGGEPGRSLPSKVVRVATRLFGGFASLLLGFLLVVMLCTSWKKGRWR